MSAADPRFSATIDAQLLYWIRLPPEAGKLDLQQQRYRFERVLPVPVESLHVVATRLRDGGAVLVGIEPERLHSHLAARQDVTAATWELLPDRVPEHLALADAPAALRGLNLLQDAFEPARRRRLRRMSAIASGLALALLLVLALVGIERRVAAQDAAAEAARRSGQEQLGKALGQTGGRLPNAALLTQELRRLELAARGPAATQLDSAGILQRLWAAWPADIRTQVETVSLVPDRLVVRGTLPTLADAERLAKACPTIAAGEAVFQAAPLQAEQTARGAVFLITWHAQAAGAKGGAR
jgi:hypothetical protein